MQSQYERDVLGAARLEEARRRKDKAKEILADVNENTDKEKKQDIKQKAKIEKEQYSKLKQLRLSVVQLFRISAHFVKVAVVNGLNSYRFKEIMRFWVFK